MKERIQQFLIGLIVIWIIYLVVFIFPTSGEHSAVVSAGMVIIIGSVIALFFLRYFVGQHKRTSIRTVPIQDSQQTSALKQKLESKPIDVSLVLSLAEEYVLASKMVREKMKNEARNQSNLDFANSKIMTYLEKAEKEFLKAASMDPNNPEVQIALANIHLSLMNKYPGMSDSEAKHRVGLSQQARLELRRAVEIDPKNTEYKILLAANLQQSPEIEKCHEAERILNELLQTINKIEDQQLAHIWLSNTYRSLSKVDKEKTLAFYQQKVDNEKSQIFPNYDWKTQNVFFQPDINATNFSERTLNGKIIWNKKENLDKGYKITTLSELDIKK